MRDDAASTFPVCTFKRVFDTTPEQEVLTLSELVACFRRFELKPQLLAKIEREIARSERALEQALEGADPVGERLVAILRARDEARAKNADEVLAMRAKVEEMRALARASAKRDLRLWSPVLYREGHSERGTEGVSHVSCLVLDYDSGVRIESARACWLDYFHLVHTTWSHTDAHPKFRVIFPLAVPVPAGEWEKLWYWAEEKSGGEIDPSMKGPAATYALPAVAHGRWPREAISHAAPLLDPRELGIDVGEPVRLAVRHAPMSMMLGDPEKEYLVHESTDAVYVYDDPYAGEDDGAWREEALSSVPDPPAPIHDAAAPEPAARTRAKPATKRKKKRGRTLCVDFDGVLHSYSSGWRGATVIPDPPVPGAIEWLAEAAERFHVIIFSSRNRESGGADAMRTWLRDHGTPPDVLGRLTFPRAKPPAHVYLDDRAWRFDGEFPELDDLDAFEPWHKRAPR